MILLHAAFSFNTHHWKSTIHSVIYLEDEINCGFPTILSATVHDSFILEIIQQLVLPNSVLVLCNNFKDDWALYFKMNDLSSC